MRDRYQNPRLPMAKLTSQNRPPTRTVNQGAHSEAGGSDTEARGDFGQGVAERQIDADGCMGVPAGRSPVDDEDRLACFGGIANEPETRHDGERGTEDQERT